MSLPELGGIEVHLASRLSADRRGWLDEQQPRRIYAGLVFSLVLAGISLGIGGGLFFRLQDQGRVLLLSGAACAGYLHLIRHPKWQDFCHQKPDLAATIQITIVWFILTMIPVLIFVGVRWAS